MNKLEIVSSGLSILSKSFAWVKSLFWKSNNILYINENKKVTDLWQIQRHQSLAGYHTVRVRHNTKLGFKNAQLHFLHMKKALCEILRNLTENPNLIYTGFVSTPFAAFDGYCLGDNEKIIFYDNNKATNESYKISLDKAKRPEKKIFEITEGAEEVCLVLCCSFDINPNCCKPNIPQYVFAKKSGEEVSSEYLKEVFYFVNDFLDECRDKRVQIVHLYLSARQPISFVVGTAIQSHHPLVRAYEFESGKYTWAVDIQSGKLIMKGAQDERNTSKTSR